MYLLSFSMFRKGKSMYCTVCGHKLLEDARFCDNCGAPIEPLPEQTVAAAPVAPPCIVNAQTPTSVPQNGDRVPAPAAEDPVKHTSEPETKPPVIKTPVHEPAPMPPLYQTTRKLSYEEEKKYNIIDVHPYREMGGFLGFVSIWAIVSCIVYFITFLIYAFLFLFMYPTAELVFAGTASEAMLLADGILCLNLFRRLREKDEKFLCKYQAAWLLLMLCVAVFEFVVYCIDGEVISNSDFESVFISVTDVAKFIGLSIYFGTSVRVRTYMGSDDYLKQSYINRWFPYPHPVAQYIPNQDSVETDLWICPKCRETNSSAVNICLSCGRRKTSGAFDSKWKWECPKCHRINSGLAIICICGCQSSAGKRLKP